MFEHRVESHKRPTVLGRPINVEEKVRKLPVIRNLAHEFDSLLAQVVSKPKIVGFFPTFDQAKTHADESQSKDLHNIYEAL